MVYWQVLAAQLTNELRALFPKNAVEYFVSYYDYYTPEAFNSASDTYIDKVCGGFPQSLRLKDMVKFPKATCIRRLSSCTSTS